MTRQADTGGPGAPVTGRRARRRPAHHPRAGRMRRRGIALGLAAAWLPAALAGCGSTPQTPAAPVIPPSWAASVVSAPVRTAHTALGTVGYRVTGSGPPLVLIMGYGGTMETWDPRFADALARHYRVVIFDNAGIGRTQPLPAPLTIDAMADQAGALIAALGLGRADVLGWSMGGMIAQALAVRHPSQVRRLVLCATFPGTGTVPPSPAAIRALTSGIPQDVMPELYPADQAMAYDAFSAGIAGYPAAPSPRGAVIAAQGRAAASWFAGTDPAGRKTAAISVAVLIADGTADRLDPVANDHTLARLIPRARLVLYPDAGHAFLFQEGPSFTFLIGSFLTGPPRPLGISRLRTEFLAGEAAAGAAGKTWQAKLKTLPPGATARQVAMTGQPFAAVLSTFCGQLLSSGATGAPAAAIAAFAGAEEHQVDDVTALSVQDSSTLGAWKATAVQDAQIARRAAIALRKALGLPPGP